MRDLINLTDEQIEEAFEEMGMGATIEDVVFTKDSIEDFINAAEDYAGYGAIEQDENTLLIEDAQPRKGDQRTDLYVIDFGTVRGCVK